MAEFCNPRTSSAADTPANRARHPRFHRTVQATYCICRTTPPAQRRRCADDQTSCQCQSRSVRRKPRSSLLPEAPGQFLWAPCTSAISEQLGIAAQFALSSPCSIPWSTRSNIPCIGNTGQARQDEAAQTQEKASIPSIWYNAWSLPSTRQKLPCNSVHRTNARLPLPFVLRCHASSDSARNGELAEDADLVFGAGEDNVVACAAAFRARALV